MLNKSNKSVDNRILVMGFSHPQKKYFVGKINNQVLVVGHGHVAWSHIRNNRVLIQLKESRIIVASITENGEYPQSFIKTIPDRPKPKYAPERRALPPTSESLVCSSNTTLCNAPRSFTFPEKSFHIFDNPDDLIAYTKKYLLHLGVGKTEEHADYITAQISPR